MFESAGFPKSLDEVVFNEWLEKGRTNKMGYKFLLVIWDEHEGAFSPVYAHERSAIEMYDRQSSARERLVAAYDLYSESRIDFQ